MKRAFTILFLSVLCIVGYAQTVYTYSCKTYNTYFNEIPSADKVCNYTVKQMVYEDGRMNIIFKDKKGKKAFSIDWIGGIDSGEMGEAVIIQWAGKRKGYNSDEPFVCQLMCYPTQNTALLTLNYTNREMVSYDLKLINTKIERR